GEVILRRQSAMSGKIERKQPAGGAGNWEIWIKLPGIAQRAVEQQQWGIHTIKVRCPAHRSAPVEASSRIFPVSLHYTFCPMMYHPIAACTGIFLLLLTACSNPDTRPEDGAAAPAAWAESGPDRPVEFADRRYADTVLYYQQLFAEGDMIAWAEQFADSAVFIWSSGDSLAGKPAIYEYYAERRGAYIETIRF